MMTMCKDLYASSRLTDLYREIDKWIKVAADQQKEIRHLKKIINSMTGEKDESAN